MSLIKTIDYHESTGRLKEIYDDLIKKRGKLADVHKIQSLRPESIVKHIDMYLEIMFSRSELSRAEREMMAVVTSVANNCYYCQIHHSESLNHFWKDKGKLNDLRTNYNNAQLTPKELLLCQYADQLTTQTKDFNSLESVNKLKTVGLSDEAILDATLVVAYFNFVNRIVLSLGVDIESDGGTGYKY